MEQQLAALNKHGRYLYCWIYIVVAMCKHLNKNFSSYSADMAASCSRPFDGADSEARQHVEEDDEHICRTPHPLGAEIQ